MSRAAGSFALVECRKTFGGLSLFFDGNMFAGVHGAKIAVRLPEADRVEAQARSGALPFEPVPGQGDEGVPGRHVTVTTFG